MDTSKPIAAFYCCYLLQSSIRKQSLYVGSTPNPVRRLKQHNGLVVGGAVRTARANLRPWDMACIVTGFPSHIAALQFEWAWQNSHVSLKIPKEQRINVPTTITKTTKRGATKKRLVRPKITLSEKLANLHLLLRIEAFRRWPLTVKFFAMNVYSAWKRLIETTDEPLGLATTIEYLPRNEKEKADKEAGFSLANITGRKEDNPTDGVHGLDISYGKYKSHVQKAKTLINRDASCAICKETIQHYRNFIVTCPNNNCKGVSHMDCLAKEFLQQETLKDPDEPPLLPVKGKCPSCKKLTKWIDIVTEHSIRLKAGPFDKVFGIKKQKGKTGKGKDNELVILDSEEGEDGLITADDEEDDDEEEMAEIENYDAQDYEQWFAKPGEDVDGDMELGEEDEDEDDELSSNEEEESKK